MGPLPSGDPGVSCSLASDARTERLAQWHDLIALGRVESTGYGYRIAFAPGGDLAERLARLSAAEAGCCTFFAFGIEISATDVVLRVEVPDDEEAAALGQLVFGSAPG
jgi:hypothetical protein